MNTNEEPHTKTQRHGGRKGKREELKMNSEK
jgi:hypothetical protein